MIIIIITIMIIIIISVVIIMIVIVLIITIIMIIILIIIILSILPCRFTIENLHVNLEGEFTSAKILAFFFSIFPSGCKGRQKKCLSWL